MRLLWDARFADEVDRYNLRYTCTDCVYFLPDTRTCAHEWPIVRVLASHDASEPAEEVVFCKEHEIS